MSEDVLTVGDLRRKLADLADDLPVLVAANGEYEGVPDVSVGDHISGGRVLWLEI